jgi:ubiquinone/menaquinone biosynthesis C-methylase UbiE
MNDRLKTLVAEHFSNHVNEWKTIYDKDQGAIDRFYSINIINRKTAVLRSLDEYAYGRSLKVLDAGCGPGIFMDEVLKRGHSVVGMDLSEDMVREANNVAKKYGEGRATCLQGDIGHIPFSESSFDVALCIGVLSYLQDDRTSVAELSRVVKPGGLVILALPNLIRLNVWLDPYYYLYRGPQYLYRKIRALTSTNDPGQTQPGYPGSRDINNIMRKYRRNQLSGLMRTCNLIETVRIGIGYGPLTFWRRPVLSTERSLRISDSIEKMASRKGLSLIRDLANHWVFCLRKNGTAGYRSVAQTPHEMQ